jgi:hypothetical protein
MTTAQTMLKNALRGALCALALSVLGCAGEPRLVQPSQTSAPYGTSGSEPLWAIVPLRNEAGTTAVDTLEISDKVFAAASQVRGVRTVPLNRTLAAMQALNMTELATPADARLLAKQLGVDALVLGSITAYDPYNPPKLGLALALYQRAAGGPAAAPIDPRTLEGQATEYRYFPRSAHADAPAAVVSEYLDGKDQGVLMDLRAYARGRHDPKAARGWRRYLTSMDLYSEFAAWHAVHSLVDREWVRLTGTVPAARKQ